MIALMTVSQQVSLVAVFLMEVSAFTVFASPAVDTVIAAEGKPLYLNCSIGQTQQAPNYMYSWRFNDADIQSQLDAVIFPNGTLHIIVVTADYIGEYQCLVQTGDDIAYSAIITLSLAVMDKSFSTEHPKDCHVLRDENCEFRCTIGSVPPAIISWLIDGYPVSYGVVSTTGTETSILRIPSVSSQHSGEYRCQAMNPISLETVFSHTALLNVSGPPVFLHPGQNVRVGVGDAAYLHCDPVANPSGDFIWENPNKLVIIPSNSMRHQVLDNGTLIIASVEITDAGYYTCTATNVWGSTKLTTLVEVFDQISPPRFTLTPPDMSLSLGSSVVFSCLAEGIPEPKITWYNPAGVEIGSSDNVSYPSSLGLSTLTIADGGIWTCKASNLAGSVQHSFHIAITEPAKITSDAETLSVVEGHQLTLRCVCSGTPQPQSSWSIPPGNRTISSTSILGGYILSTNGSLIISHVSRKDGGTYTCLCQNSVGNDTSASRVTVLYAPQLQSQSDVENVEVVEGSTVGVACTVSGRPSPQILWYRNYSTSSSDLISSVYPYTVLTHNNTLVLTRVTPNMQGNYTCVASNPIGVAVRVFHIFVISLPDVIVHPELVTATPGDSVVITCTVQNSHSASVLWMKDGTTLVEDGSFQIDANSSLVIPLLLSRHYGTYKCLASNRAGSQSASATVTNSDGPYWITKPSNITVPEGSYVNITCEATSLLQVTYKWLYQKQLSSPVYVVQNASYGGAYIIESVATFHTGFFTCVAADDNNSRQTTIYLTVYGKPQLVSKSPDISAEEGDDATLNCQFRSLHSSFNTTWYTPADRVYSYTSAIDLSEVRIDQHWGEWSCTACNTAGCTTEHVFLQVRGIPQLHNCSITSAATAVADQLTFSCYSRGSPQGQMYYYTDRTDLLTSNIPGHSMRHLEHGLALVVDRRQLRSAYKCVTSNQYGSDSLVISKPEKPSDIHVETTNNSIALSWPRRLDVYPPITTYHVIVGRDQREEVHKVNNTHYKLTELSPHVQLNISLAALNELGESERLTLSQWTRSDTPSAPVNLRVSKSTTDTGFNIRWDLPAMPYANPDDLEYEIQVLFGTNPWTTTTKLLGVDFYPQLSGEYTTAVRAFNSQAYSGQPYSPWTGIMHTSVSHDDVTRPAPAPRNLTAKLIAVNSILLSWEMFYGIENYQLAFTLTSGETTTVQVIGDGSYLYDNLPSTLHLVKVAAVTLSGGVGRYSTIDVRALMKNQDGQADDSSNAQSLSQSQSPDFGTLLAIIFGSVLLIVLIVSLAVLVMYRRSRKLPSIPSYLSREDINSSDIIGDYRNSRRSYDGNKAQLSVVSTPNLSGQSSTKSSPSSATKQFHSQKRRGGKTNVAAGASGNVASNVYSPHLHANEVFSSYRSPADDGTLGSGGTLSSRFTKNSKKSKGKYGGSEHQLHKNKRITQSLPDDEGITTLRDKESYQVIYTGYERAVDVDTTPANHTSHQSTRSQREGDNSSLNTGDEATGNLFDLIAHLEESDYGYIQSDSAHTADQPSNASKRRFLKLSQSDPRLRHSFQSSGSHSRRRPVNVTDNSSEDEADLSIHSSED